MTKCITIITVGEQGPSGPAGEQGEAGAGVPAGGSTGQVLRKASDADLDTEWGSASGTGDMLAANNLSELTNFAAALQNLGLTATATEINYLGGVSGNVQEQLNGKAALSHGHAISDVSGLQDALNGNSDSGHGHSISDISGLQDALDGKAESSHSHSVGEVTGAVASDPSVVEGAEAITNIIGLTQEQYDALEAPEAGTLYAVME